MEETDKVVTILNQVSELSNEEKFMLYLKLPTEDIAEESSKTQLSTMAKRTDAALKWIRKHCIEEQDAYVPKQDVYDHYREEFEAAGNNPLCSADFGKMIKLVFPKIYHRRLGKRGKSRYYYGGLKMAESHEVEPCPRTMSPSSPTKEDSALYTLSCQLVCEWASQLLDKTFVDIKSLSEYLISIGLSCGKTAAKFQLLLGGTSPLKKQDKDKKSPTTRHQDRQMLLQRKLQHKEIIRQHKQKLVQQQKEKRDLNSSNIAAVSSAFSSTVNVQAFTGQWKGTTLLPKVPVKGIQPRPLSVQPYASSSGSSAQHMCVTSNEFTADNVSHFSPSLSNKVYVRETTPTEMPTSSTNAMGIGRPSSQPKRCHSTSVVEKHSAILSYNIKELLRQVSEHGFNANTSIVRDVEEKLDSNTLTPTEVSRSSSPSQDALFIPYSAARNITRMLESPSPVTLGSSDGVQSTQHSKRNGDSMSPDRFLGTKRRCITSLGVTKQRSLDNEKVMDKNHGGDFTRLRPYSCPISSRSSNLDHKSASVGNQSLSQIQGLEVKTCTSVTTVKSSCSKQSTKADGERKSHRASEKQKETRGNDSESHKAFPPVAVHVVQKPIVINRPVSVLSSVASCPDFKQATTGVEAVSQVVEPKVEKTSYNILNTLLSTSCDIIPEPVVVKEDLGAIASSDTSPYLFNNLTKSHSPKPDLQSNQARAMVDKPPPAENVGILSTLSSRSAFVPVSSQKLQVVSSILKETGDVIRGPSRQKLSTVLHKNLEHQQNSLSTVTAKNESTHEASQSVHLIDRSAAHKSCQEKLSLCSNICLMGKAYHELNEKVPSASSTFTLKSHKDSVMNTLMSTHSSSSSSSSSSTLRWSGESTSSGCESAFTTPVPTSGVEKDVGQRSAPTTIPRKQSASLAENSIPVAVPLTQCTSSSSVKCNTTVVQSQNVSQNTTRTSQARNTTASPITPPKRVARNRFTPIRPKLGGSSTSLSPQKLGGQTPNLSPQKKDMRPVSTILKEQRAKNAQDLLVNLAIMNKGEVKLQMPAEFLGLSPRGKSKSGDVLVTIGPPSSNASLGLTTNVQSQNLDTSSQLWPLTSPVPPNKEITVVVESGPQTAPQHNISPALSSCLISPAPYQLLQGVPQSTGVQSTSNLGHNTMMTQSFFPPKIPLSPANSSSQFVIVPTSTPFPQPLQNKGLSTSKPIIVEDGKGNRYSLDQKSECTTSSHSLQNLTDILKRSDSQVSNTIGQTDLMSPSHLKGHVVGPDANGQTYLQVLSTDPFLSAATSSALNLPKQQSSVVVTTAPAVTKEVSVSQSTGVYLTGSGRIQSQAPSSAALLSELSQLASSGKNFSGQALIQHNSASSAFHKCSSGPHRKLGDSQENIVRNINDKENRDHQENLEENMSRKPSDSCPTNPVINNQPKSITGAEEKEDNQSISPETSEPMTSQSVSDGDSLVQRNLSVRKRKASKSQQEDHKDRKRLNASIDNTDNDVFIVKVEDSQLQQTSNEISRASLSQAVAKSSVTPSETSDESEENIKESVSVSEDKLSDTDTLLNLIDKTLTVRETVMALNLLRAKRDKENKLERKENKDQRSKKEKFQLSKESPCGHERGLSESGFQSIILSSDSQQVAAKHRQRSLDKTDKKSQACRSSSFSPHACDTISKPERPKKSDVIDKDAIKLQRTGRRHISLNLESLESDALLDTEPALDHKLVGDITDATSVKSDHKTSVGVAAKSARSSTSSAKHGESHSSLKQCGPSHLISNRASRSHQMILDKKRLDKLYGSVIPKESKLPLQHEKNNSNDNVRQDNCTQEKNSWQSHTSVSEVDTNQYHLPETRRSKSCIRDILQRGTKLSKEDILNQFSSATNNIKSKAAGFSSKIPPKLAELKDDLSNFTDSQEGSEITKLPKTEIVSLCKLSTSKHPTPVPYFSDSTPTVSQTDKLGNSNNYSDDSCATGTFPSQNKPSSIHMSTRSSEEINTTPQGLSTSDSELPGEIVDFITESMSSERQYHHAQSASCVENPLNSLLADLVRNSESDEVQNVPDVPSSTVWRSLSVPNTVPDIHYDFRHSMFQNENTILSKQAQFNHSRCQSVAECGKGTYPTKVLEVPAKDFSPEHTSLTTEDGSVTPTQCSPNSNRFQDKDIDTLSQLSSDIHTAVASGTFLSPVGPAKLTRRLSIERSASGDRSMSKTPVEIGSSKVSTDRPPSRIKTPIERSQTKTPVDRSQTKTPVDRSLAKTPVDRSEKKTRPLEGFHIRDHTTAAVLQQNTKENDSHKLLFSGVTRTSVHNRGTPDRMFRLSAMDGKVCQTSFENVKEDRYHNYTPISDGGYSSVSQTPVSDGGYNSVSPSPVMMSAPGLFGECGQRDITSPSTIFMPVRSDSVVSIGKIGRNIETNDNIGTKTNSQYVNQSKFPNVKQNHDVRVDLNSIGENYANLSSSLGHEMHESTLLQDAIDEALFDAPVIKAGHDYGTDILKDNPTSLLDFEKLMSVHCIPTPPCSPSLSPQLPADAIQSPLSFNLPGSNAFCHMRQQNAARTSLSSCFAPPISPVISIGRSTTMSSSRLQTTPVSPAILSCSDRHSPPYTPNIPSSPHVITRPSSSPHQYSSHPSPPFTPSSQHCLVSPRCPTPCSHRSLVSPRCATPCGDLSSAPNRFMPIQTSGLLATSHISTQTYIPPIRPVVALASVPNQNGNNSVLSSSHDFKSEMSVDKAGQLNEGHLSSASDFRSFNVFEQNYNSLSLSLDRLHDKPTNSRELQQDFVEHQQSVQSISSQGNGIHHSIEEDSKVEKSGHPALILSLSGSIGSVSGQGMKAGWGKDIKNRASSKEQNTSVPAHLIAQDQRRGRDLACAVNSLGQEKDLKQSSEILPSYEEAVSLLSGQSSRADARNQVTPIDSKKRVQRGIETSKQGKTNDSNYQMQDLSKSVFSRKPSIDKVSAAPDKGRNLEHQQQSHKTASQSSSVASMKTKGFHQMMGKEKKPVPSTDTGMCFQNSASHNTVSYPFSHHLTILSGCSQSSSLEPGNVSTSQMSSKIGTCQNFQGRINLDTRKESNLSAMLQTPPFGSSYFHSSNNINLNQEQANSKPLRPVSDLPTAYYAGTAPNIDLTKVSLLSAGRTPNLQPGDRPSLEQEPHMLNSGSGMDIKLDGTTPSQDDLEETLDVLKSMDSQYFQHDEDSNSDHSTL